MSFFPILAVQGKTTVKEKKKSASCSSLKDYMLSLLSYFILWHFVKYEKPYLLSRLLHTAYCTKLASTQWPRVHNVCTRKTISDFYLIDNTIKHPKKLLTLIVQVNYFNTFSLSFQFTSVLWDHRGGKTPGIFVPRLRWIFGYHRKVFLRFTD